MKKKYQKSQSLVELLVAIAISSILLPALFMGLVASREGKAQQAQRLNAVSLLKETEEIIRNIREKGWAAFAVNGTFHPTVSDSSWILAANPETIGDFTRQIIISDSYRDTNGAIVLLGGNVDPSTKKVTIIISWNMPSPANLQSDMYLTRYLDNLSWTQTTKADFDLGTKFGTTITEVDDGEVTLGAGGISDWCDSTLTIAALDLPKDGVANAINAIEGQAFAGTGESASGISFAKIDISNTNPPTAAIAGTFDGYKTNDIFGEANYAYLATDNNFKEVVILNISSLPYTEIGYFNTPLSPEDATSIYVSGNRGYVTAGNWLYIFDLSNKSGSRPIVGLPFFLLGSGTSVVVKENYAYVSISNSELEIEMQIVDITNPGALFQVGYANVNGQNGKRVFINNSSTRAYLVTNAASFLREFFIIDIVSKTGLRPVISSYEANGMNPKNLAVVPGNRAIIVGTGGEEYQVININDEAIPARCGGLEINSGVNGIASILEADGDAYSYIITGEANAEFKIIEGGPGGEFAMSGTFESSTFDTFYNTAFNRLTITTDKPPQTDIKFQIAGADPIAESCDGISYNFVGPDGSDATFFTSEAGIPFNDDGINFENPARCFRYKAFLLTSDSFQSPVLYDITVNYSP